MLPACEFRVVSLLAGGVVVAYARFGGMRYDTRHATVSSDLESWTLGPRLGRAQRARRGIAERYGITPLAPDKRRPPGYYRVRWSTRWKPLPPPKPRDDGR